MNEKQNIKHNSIVLSLRNKLQISGVLDVMSFDENYLLIKTDCGIMTVEGIGIKIEVLDTDSGNLSLVGSFNAIYYNDDGGEKKGFWKKLSK